MTWNRQREQLTGADQLVSIICLFVYPIASLDQIAVLIYGNGGDMYIRPQIYERSRELELTRKRSSIEVTTHSHPHQKDHSSGTRLSHPLLEFIYYQFIH